MFDLRSIVNNSLSVTINQDIPVTILKSTGYTISDGYKQVPTYNTISGYAQIQAIDAVEIAHYLTQYEGMNLQGTARVIYLSGVLNGILRPDGIGGDLVQFNGETWLVVKVIEYWPLWTKALIIRQENQ
jgi:hypothetical protein